MPVTVWFNKSLSSLCNVIEVVRAAADPPLRLLVTHTAADFAAYPLADSYEQEPRGLGGEQYVDWCLDFARRHGVRVFVPGKELRAVVRRRDNFDALDVQLVAAADADTLKTIEPKSGLYGAVGADAPIPDHHVVRTRAEFDAACDRVLAHHATVCFKPNVSVYGLGFRVVTSGGSPLERLLAGDVAKITRDEARRLFGEQEQFREVLVMPYLPGPERSVDCLAHEGRLLRAVVRCKPPDGYAQLLEDNPPLVECCRRLAAKLRLGGIFNVQFRDLDGVSYLLEINLRMSGGIHYACLSGLPLPYWAIRLALGGVNESDIPQPRLGGRVVHYERALLL